jgi:hypothetical protein
MASSNGLFQYVTCYNNILDGLKNTGKLTDSICPRQIIFLQSLTLIFSVLKIQW